MAENESPKTAQEKAKELLRSGRSVFLQTTGYTDREIVGFNDLAALPSKEMGELLHKKALRELEGAGKAFSRQNIRIRRIRPKVKVRKRK